MKVKAEEYYLAIDMGASGGRHILGHIAGGQLVLEEIHRFPNSPVVRGNSLTWDTERLFSEIVAGIKLCCALGKPPRSIGIDTWGVDYVLVDGAGKVLDPAYSYRDSRSAAFMDTPVPFEELYRITGIAQQPFNTVYQLLADKSAGRLREGQRLFFLPEYFSYRLTGNLGVKSHSEYTIASTSGLLDAAQRNWALPLVEELGLPPGLFDPVREPPYAAGTISDRLRAETGCNAEIIMVAGHDTASAVSVVNESDLYISSGTWSLLGIQSSPILTEAARRAGYTNEGALNGKVRFLKNIMGLWMLQQIRHELGDVHSFAELEALAREVESRNEIIMPIDVNQPQFLSPPSMIQAIKDEYRGRNWSPESPGELAYCVYLGLASGYKNAVTDLEAITGKTYPAIAIIGGGSKDAFLNSLAAKHTGKAVYAGHSEATATGNILLQMKYAGVEKPLSGFSETMIKV